MDGKQSTNMLMPSFNDGKMWCLDTAWQNGGEQIFNLSHEDVHTSSIQPAPDPEKLDPHLSPLGGEMTPTMTSTMTSTPISKISFDLYSDAVNRDPNVKRFSATVDWNDCIKGFQGQVVSAVMNRKEWSVYWKIAHEAADCLHDHNNICTNKEICQPD
jgi:hypothetical protein